MILNEWKGFIATKKTHFVRKTNVKPLSESECLPNVGFFALKRNDCSWCFMSREGILCANNNGSAFANVLRGQKTELALDWIRSSMLLPLLSDSLKCVKQGKRWAATTAFNNSKRESLNASLLLRILRVICGCHAMRRKKKKQVE